jgi:hypothetical protein
VMPISHDRAISGGLPPPLLRPHEQRNTLDIQGNIAS